MPPNSPFFSAMFWPSFLTVIVPETGFVQANGSYVGDRWGMRFLSTFLPSAGITFADADVVATDITPTAARVLASAAIRLVLIDMRSSASYLVPDFATSRARRGPLVPRRSP